MEAAIQSEQIARFVLDTVRKKEMTESYSNYSKYWASQWFKSHVQRLIILLANVLCWAQSNSYKCSNSSLTSSGLALKVRLPSSSCMYNFLKENPRGGFCCKWNSDPKWIYTAWKYDIKSNEKTWPDWIF